MLCGTGLFDGDLFTDILIYDKNDPGFVIAYGNGEGYEYFRYKLPRGFAYKEGDRMFAGDYDGDGVSDLVVISGITVSTYRLEENGFKHVNTVDLPFAEEFVTYAVADMNSDGASDIVAFMKDPGGTKNKSGNDIYGTLTYMSNRDGSLMGADRIGVATSTDGIHFERKTDSTALISPDKYSCYTHQEVIYVPDDPDGLCFWMYVRYVRNNVNTAYIRVRSADPTCFDAGKDLTVVNGFSQIGNQIGYINDYDGKGNRLFVRISFAEYSEGVGKAVFTTVTEQIKKYTFFPVISGKRCIFICGKYFICLFFFLQVLL